jgi:hypothetical protein
LTRTSTGSPKTSGAQQQSSVSRRRIREGYGVGAVAKRLKFAGSGKVGGVSQDAFAGMFGRCPGRARAGRREVSLYENTKNFLGFGRRFGGNFGLCG